MRSICLFLTGFLVAGAAFADEGMWTFDNPPRELIRQRYGVDLPQAWLDRVQHSVVRLENGCTGSFVSAEGLVLTNHHCVEECLADRSSPQRDLVGDGFLAATRGQEERCESERISMLLDMRNVTDEVNAAVAGLDDAKANEARKRKLTTLEQNCEQAAAKDRRTGPLVCEAVTLYQGGQYWIYRYKRYTDVRLVFAPEAAISSFGGDPDNFQFPRYALDMGVLRVYENGKPARTPTHLDINFAGPAAGELTFVAGSPGATQRLETPAQLEVERSVYLPFWLLRYSELRGRLIEFSKQSPENERIAVRDLNQIENSIKVRRKQLDALLDDRMMNAKRADQAALQARAQADPALAALAGSAWSDIAKAQQINADNLVRYTFIEGGAAVQGSLFAMARMIVRGVAERDKPNVDRLREYTDARLKDVEQQLGANLPVYPSLEQLRLTFGLERMREWLGPDDPFVHLVLGHDSPDQVAARLLAGTKLASAEARLALWKGGSAAVAASDDPMIRLAAAIDPEARVLRKKFEDEVEAPTGIAQEKIARVRFAVLGTSTYPDATFTPRLSYGKVAAWVEKGVPLAPFTTLETAFSRATGQDPFRFPDRWLAVRAKLDPATRFNFSTTHDITGGNSGSPTVNLKGELVGLMFDGNIHSIAGDYAYDPEMNRATAVHPAIMREALAKVYGATALFDELSGKRVQ
jgi:hypothetical protein